MESTPSSSRPVRCGCLLASQGRDKALYSTMPRSPSSRRSTAGRAVCLSPRMLRQDLRHEARTLPGREDCTGGRIPQHASVTAPCAAALRRRISPARLKRIGSGLFFHARYPDSATRAMKAQKPDPHGRSKAGDLRVAGSLFRDSLSRQAGFFPSSSSPSSCARGKRRRFSGHSHAWQKETAKDKPGPDYQNQYQHSILLNSGPDGPLHGRQWSGAAGVRTWLLVRARYL